MSDNPGIGGALAPLAVRMRPRTLRDIVGQQHLVTPGSPLSQLANPEARAGISVVLWGPPGTGKTSIAHVIAAESGRMFVELSAVTAGVKDVRDVMERARTSREMYGTSTVLFIDEIHRFNKAQQDALLPGVENGIVTLVAATTENPSFSVVTPLLSRSLLLRLEPLTPDDIATLLDHAVQSPLGLAGELSLSQEAREALVLFASGDARRALTSLEGCVAVAEAQGNTVISADMVSQVVDRALLRYDRQGDEHYDVISAFIKSIRGSDADAAVHYLARMIEAGEDPRFIGRRLVISASEDVGLAEPRALEIARAAADAVAQIGMPEGRIPLAEATIFLALSPKSNAAYVAINAALNDVRSGKGGVVPAHLRDANYSGASRLGHGAGYIYAHDAPHGIAAQTYLPEELRDVRYYVPTDRGMESTLSERWLRIQRILREH